MIGTDTKTCPHPQIHAHPPQKGGGVWNQCLVSNLGPPLPAAGAHSVSGTGTSTPVITRATLLPCNKCEQLNPWKLPDRLNCFNTIESKQCNRIEIFLSVCVCFPLGKSDKYLLISTLPTRHKHTKCNPCPTGFRGFPSSLGMFAHYVRENQPMEVIPQPLPEAFVHLSENNNKSAPGGQRYNISCRLSAAHLKLSERSHAVAQKCGHQD